MEKEKSEFVLRTIRFPRALYDVLEKKKSEMEKAFVPSSVTSLVLQACAAAYAEKEECEVAK